MSVEPAGHQDPSKTETDGWFVPWRFAVLLALLIAACFPQVVAGLEGFAYLDYGQFSYPLAFYQREAFWRGEVPLWNPLSNCGSPFLAQWNTLPLYPLSLVYLVLPLPWSLSVFCLLHLFLAGVGMYFLAYRWTGNRLAAALGGTAFAFNGMTWYALMWTGTIAALGCLPWVVLAMERAWRKGGRYLVVAAFVGAVQMLSGGVEVVILTWLLLAGLFLCQLAAGEPSRRILAARALGSSLLVAGLAAAQLLPFLDLLAHSQRHSSYANPNLGAMPLSGWANYLVPIFRCSRNPQGIFVQPDEWTASYYAGVSVLVLAGLAVWRMRQFRLRLLAALAGFALVMAQGGHNPVYAWFKQLFPGLGFIRFPVKFVMLPTFVFPLLAACGLAWMRALPPSAWPSEWKRVKALTLALLAGMGLIAGAAWAYPSPHSEPNATLANACVRALFLALILGGILFLRRESEPKLRHLFEVGLVVLLWFDVFTHNGNLSPTVPGAVFEPDAVRSIFNWQRQPAAGSSRAMQSPECFRTMLAASFQDLVRDTRARRLTQFFNFNLLDHVPKVDGFSPVNLKHFADVLDQLYWTTNEAPRLRDFLCVSHVSSPTSLFDWTSRTSFLPLVTAGQQPVFAADTIALQGVLAPDFEPLRKVYLPAEAQGKLSAVAAAKVSLGALVFSAHRLEIPVTAEAPALVVVAQAFYHCWHAYVDGRPVSLWRGNYAFQALEVPAGQHQVVLKYEDRIFRCGVGLSVVSLLVCAGIWFLPPLSRLSVGRVPGPGI